MLPGSCYTVTLPKGEGAVMRHPDWQVASGGSFQPQQGRIISLPINSTVYARAGIRDIAARTLDYRLVGLQPAYILPAANIYVLLMTHSACQTEGVDLT
jgi:hypothetical protein